MSVIKIDLKLPTGKPAMYKCTSIVLYAYRVCQGFRIPNMMKLNLKRWNLFNICKYIQMLIEHQTKCEWMLRMMKNEEGD